MNKYTRVRQVGEGAFGKAVLVKHKNNSKQFVVKEINITKMAAKEREEARKEVAVLAQLKHRNIVSYVESFEEKGSLYIVMNYCSGGDLFQRINERRGQLFSEDLVLDWFAQLCLAVKHIHDRKILHRDIKCQNIFLTQSGVVQLGDFGIAKILSSTAQFVHTCIGTPYYLSPEIVENMPYNNKSDIWSVGCVLYELTTLKHAFEAGNMKNLVLKIIRGSYPPISPQFSYDLRGLIAQLLKRNPRDRPSVNHILNKNFIMQRVRRLMPAEDLADEFSHTVMHGHKIAKALPPAPKPSIDPVKKSGASTPRPGSAAKKYNPAAVYGAPVNSSRNRLSGELKKRPVTPGRQLPLPGQGDLEKRRKELQEIEQKRRAELKKREQEMNERRYRDLVERQKVARLNKAREEGWRNVLTPTPGADEKANRTPTPNNVRPKSPRPLPEPRVNNENRNRGNYEGYMECLDKLNLERQPPTPEPRAVYNPNHIDVVNIVAAHQGQDPQQWQPVLRPQFNMGPLGVPVQAVIDQAGRDRQLGAQAAYRARVVEDYMQRQRDAALNKMRAQHDLFGMYRPTSADRRTPVPAPKSGSSPKRGGGGDREWRVGVAGRNREEQEYLEKLRQIRMQNMKDRRAILKGNQAGKADSSKNSPDERRKKQEALKEQAEKWAEMKKVMQAKQEGGQTPASPVPLTGALQAIGAAEKLQQQQQPKSDEKLQLVPLTDAMQAIAGVVPPRQDSPAESGRPKSALQIEREKVLKKLNEKIPSRGKWGAPASPAVPTMDDVGRGRWGSPVSPAISAGEENSRPKWGDGKGLQLSKVPLETTGSTMEATGINDKVIRIVGEPQSKYPEVMMNQGGMEAMRKNWGRDSNIVRILDKMPVCGGDTCTLSESSQPPTPVPPVGVGATVVLYKPPTPGQTIVISGGSDGGVGGVVTDGPAEVSDKSGQPALEKSATVVLSSGSIGKNVAAVDEPDSGRVAKAGEGSSASTTMDQRGTNADNNRDGSKSVQMNLTNGNFDLKNVELLRTCSAPDLTLLFSKAASDRANSGSIVSDCTTPSTVRRHHSLDLTSANQNEGRADDDDDDDDEFAEEDIDIADDEDNEEDELENDGDEEDEDMRSIRETMASILDDGSDEDKERTMTDHKQLTRGSTAGMDEQVTIKQAASKVVSKRGGIDGRGDRDDDDDGGGGGGGNTEKENAGDLVNDDSDDETIFGDEDDNEGTKDYDRFGRLEQLRKDLETELGAEKLVEVYKTVQKLQEDDEGNLEDGAQVAIQLLGQDKQHLFPRIFQLVMSDTAFTES